MEVRPYKEILYTTSLLIVTLLVTRFSTPHHSKVNMNGIIQFLKLVNTKLSYHDSTRHVVQLTVNQFLSLSPTATPFIPLKTGQST